MMEENRQVEGEKEKMQLKRLKNPRRYRCAAVGCGVEADSEKMLSQCTSYSLFLFPPSDAETSQRFRKMRL